MGIHYAYDHKNLRLQASLYNGVGNNDFTGRYNVFRICPKSDGVFVLGQAEYRYRGSHYYLGSSVHYKSEVKPTLWAYAEQALWPNFTLLATPAEGLSGRFVRIDKQIFGEIPGVTDRDYYTNSFHVPVYFNIRAFDKIRLEAPYHALTNAGHISYVELDGDTCQNLPAFEQIIRCMKEQGIGYGSVNHPVDRDPVCGYTGVIGDVCPRCGRREGESVPIEKLRRLKKMFPDVPIPVCGDN